MNRLFVTCILIHILALFYLVGCNDPKETVNTCVAHSMPAETLDLLAAASSEILDFDTDELKSNLSKIQESLNQIKASISILSRSSDNELINKSLNDILSHRRSLNGTLQQVLVTVTQNKQVMEDINEEHSRNFSKLWEKIEEFINNNGSTEEGATPVDNRTTVPEEVNVTNYDDPKLKASNEDILCRPTALVDSELLMKQNETNVLLHSLLAETRELKVLQKEMKALSIENQILKKKLDKYNGGTRSSDCSDIRKSGLRTNGVYEIFPNRCDCGPSTRVWCDMETEDGGWTVVLQRSQIKKLENFTRSWSDYENGFGHPESEYWIGLRTLHQLTAFRRFVLRLDVSSRANRHKWGQWKKFEVASGEQKYKLSVGDFDLSSTLGDVFRSHDNQYFSTVDSDNDSSYDNNCAGLMQGGWWYGKCYDINPTGSFNSSDVRMGVSTALFSRTDKSLVPLKRVVMKIKPLECVFQNSLSFSIESCNNN